MKTILLKPRQIAMLLMGMAVAMIACEEPEPSDTEDGPGGRKSRVERMIDNNIVKLSNTKDWHEAQELYGKIKYDIEHLNLKRKVRKDFNKMLPQAYCLCMDSIMYFHLAGECKPFHGELKEIHGVRNSDDFAEISLSDFHQQVEAQYAYHQNMIDIIIPDLRKNKQSPTSFRSSYKTQKEADVVKQANAYLDEKPTCLEIQNGLTKVINGDYFDGWRLSFCQGLVGYYLKKTEWNEGDENILLGNLSFYTDKHPNSSTVKKWFQQIEEFKAIYMPQPDTLQLDPIK